MNKTKPVISWRLKLILVLGCLGGLGVFMFGKHVDSMSDLPLGPTPLSWKFKSNSRLVSTTFSEGKTQMAQSSGTPVLPAIDTIEYGETKLALFALG